MKVQLVKDERYPHYEAMIMDGTYPPWGLGIDWPEDLDLEHYNWVCYLFSEWQETLAKLYNSLEVKTTWPETTTPLVTHTSSTLTF